MLVLDVPVEVGHACAGRRRQMTMGFPAPVGPGLAHGAADRFRREDAELFRRVREVYLERARTHPGRYAVIDTSAGEEATTERVRAETPEWFPHRHRTITGRWPSGGGRVFELHFISARRATRHEQRQYEAGI